MSILISYVVTLQVDAWMEGDMSITWRFPRRLA